MASNKELPAAGHPEHGGEHAPAELPVDAITKLEMFLERRWRTVVSLLALFVAIVVVYFYMKYKNENAVTEANNAFMAAETRADLEGVLKTHAGTAAAGSALYSIADRQLAVQKFDEARASLEQFVSDYPDHGLHFNALVGRAGIAEKQGKLDEAQAHFQKVIDAGDQSALAPLAAIGQAELFVSRGELEKAKQLYESFGVNYSGSPFVPKATQRLEAVEKRIALKAAPEAPVEPAPEPAPAPEKPAEAGAVTEPTPAEPAPAEPESAPTEPAAASGEVAPEANVESSDPAPVAEEPAAAAPEENPDPAPADGGGGENPGP